MLEHTSQHYEQELQGLKEQILILGGTVEEMIDSAIKALLTRDSSLARQVIARDSSIDAGELEVDHRCVNILALRQPAGIDLRFITTALKIVTDLERMGDLTVNIAERAIELNHQPPLKPYVDVSRMASSTAIMVRNALDSFVNRRPDLAREVLAADDEIDELNEQIFQALLSDMTQNPQNVARSLRITFIVKYLERIADHSTNIAQMLIFLCEGRDVRHPSTAGTPPSSGNPEPA